MPSRIPATLVVGLARSGEAAALALARRGVRVIGVDADPLIDAGRLRSAGVEVQLGASADLALLNRVELLVKSPGVPSESPLVAAAHERGLDVWSEVELGARLLGDPTAGVTGTNGKTTTAELLAAMFEAAGRPVHVAGNVGRPLCALDGVLRPGDTVVCELSSFQLEDIVAFRTPIAVLLNLAPDHLDRHGTLARYRDAKLRIFENQRAGDVAVVPRGFGPVPGAGFRIEFHANDPLPAEPRIPGAHNRENAAAATAAARAAGLGDESIARALQIFPGVPHRLEPVGLVNGVQFVNDSKATNPESAQRGLEAYRPGLRVILGGSRKGTPFAALARVARERAVARAYLIGETSGEIAAVLEAEAVPFAECGDLETAVRAAFADAKPGDIVLLSPACASYDQFANFEERGDRFRALVALL